MCLQSLGRRALWHQLDVTSLSSNLEGGFRGAEEAFEPLASDSSFEPGLQPIACASALDAQGILTTSGSKRLLTNDRLWSFWLNISVASHASLNLLVHLFYSLPFQGHLYAGAYTVTCSLFGVLPLPPLKILPNPSELLDFGPRYGNMASVHDPLVVHAGMQHFCNKRKL